MKNKGLAIRVLSIALLVMMAVTIIPIGTASEVYAAGCNHKELNGRSAQTIKKDYCYKAISSTKKGAPVYGGWILQRSQRVNGYESATTIRGKKFTVERTVSTSLTGSVSASKVATVEAKVGATATWKKEKFYAYAANSARNRNNTSRWVGYCVRSRYQEYLVTYVPQDQHWCRRCGKIWYTDGKKYTAKVVKKEGTDGAYFYADKANSLTNKRAGTFKTDGVVYEKKNNYMAKGNTLITGEATYRNQNFNAFSNIKNWK